mmetsp:Transcript_5754/g.8461  ORF Transcript_5754/g.8461 Transcript_5754/m.8461 type:complete len:180 (+) Transcript_5754:687-1226(+)
MIKDPYHWTLSMCRHPYTAHTESRACPGLLRQTPRGETVVSKVNVNYLPKFTTHDSYIGLWNDYNKLYDEATYPRLIVRYEDLLFHPDYVISEVCKCAGGRVLAEDERRYITDNAKAGQKIHEGASDLLSAVMRYGDEAKRVEGFTDEERSYAERALNKDLVDKFDYKVDSLVGKMAQK